MRRPACSRSARLARHASAVVAELLVLRAVGLTRRQATVSAAAAAVIAFAWMPIGAAFLTEPRPEAER